MGFSKIKQKGESLGKVSGRTKIKKSKYVNPLYALELIGMISSQKNESEVDLSKDFEEYTRISSDLITKIDRTIYDCILRYKDYRVWKEYKELFEDFKFITSLPKQVISFIENNSNSSSIKVAVVGKFSSGKSTFINALSGAGAFLPADVNPTSIVNTIIDFSPSAKEMTVIGKNFANQLVKLSPEVLECIQHSNNASGNISVVLNKLLVELPVASSNPLKDFTFYDTPGYGNSSNSRYDDSSKYLEIIKDCAAVIYCHNIQKPTLEKDDLKVLTSIREKNPACPICIVFTRGKRAANAKDIIASATVNLRQVGIVTNVSISIVDSDAANGKVDFITQGSVEGLLRYINQKVSREITPWQQVETVFNYLFNEFINQTTELHCKFQSERRDFQRKMINENPYALKNLRGARFSELSNDSKKFLYALLDKYESEEDSKDKNLKFIIDSLFQLKNKLLQERANLLHILKRSQQAALEKKNRFRRVESIVSDRKMCTDIFMAISLGDMLSFLECFSGRDGVDIAKTDGKGFNVMTRVAESGNLEMMKFLLNNNAAVDIKDKNGKRAIDIAVSNHDRTMTALLFKANPELRSEKSRLSVLASQTKFENFLNNL